MALLRKLCKVGSKLTEQMVLDILVAPYTICGDDNLDYPSLGFVITVGVFTAPVWMPLVGVSTVLGKLSQEENDGR